MIKVHNLTKNYGDRKAIDQLQFTVNKGEVVGFLGPNGAGKSTTMKIITGFMAPSSGSVEVDGFDVFEDPIEVKKRIGYLPETPPVYGDMRVRDYLRFCAQIKGVPRQQIGSAVDAAIEKTSLQEVENRMIQNLSKGFKQRVGLAQALVGDPDILILDEPSVGLDPTQVVEMRKLIAGLRGQHTIILSTHILPEVQANCDRIIIINKGKIVAAESLNDIAKAKTGICRIGILTARQPEQAKAAIAELKFVSSVRLNGARLEVEMEQNPEFIEAVAAKIVASGVGLLEFKIESSNLEEIFIRLTSPTQAQAGGL
jgi:ABC-2 type transport system ATP-binding protein